ncbi:MAG: T9SS type A sorting domain-containing protein [Bacteroidia bacterium]|nr:T9SS type A sorting domain-containing protein [Bacteroidia bacterium]
MNIRYNLLGMLVFLLTLPMLGSAQVCVPDPAFTAPGIYPPTLPAACVGLPYNTSLTLVVPVDTTVALPPFGTFTLPIDSIVLDNILGLPAGFTLGCNPSSCGVAGGASGCINISGTPTMADTIDLEVAITIYLVTPFGPLQQKDTVAGFFTLFINPGFTTTVTKTDAACGTADGSAMVAASGGANVFTYAWSNGDTTSSVANLAAGIYTVVTTDGTGCSKTDTVNISTSGSNPTLSTDTNTWVGCASTGGGSVSVSSTGGDGSYSYIWSNGATTASVSGLPAGSYTVTVSDGLGCQDFETITVTAPAELSVATINEMSLACNGDNSGLIEISATGGLGTLTYTWTGLPNETGPLVDNLPAGSYDVLVEDEAGCQKTVTNTLTEPAVLAVNLTFTGETAFGQQDGTVIASVSGGTMPYTYAWSNGATTDSIGGLAPAVYVLTITDANGCVLVDSVETPAAALAIEDQLGIHVFEIAPNPSHGFVRIAWDLGSKSATLRLLDLRGALLQELGSVDVVGEMDVQLSLPAGLYLIELKTEAGSGYRKLMVK